MTKLKRETEHAITINIVVTSLLYFFDFIPWNNSNKKKE